MEKSKKEQTKIVIENAELKQASIVLNQVSKQHQKAKDLLSEASHDFALLKAILKYEKRTTSRPEEIYIGNLRKRLETNLAKLTNEIYCEKKVVGVLNNLDDIDGDIWTAALIQWLGNVRCITVPINDLIAWILDNKAKD